LRFSGDAAFLHHRRTALRFEERFFTAFILPGDAWRSAVVTSKSRIGKAVERNRVKRRLRAAFAAAMKNQLSPLEVVLYAKASVLKADFPDLQTLLSKNFHEVDSRSAG